MSKKVTGFLFLSLIFVSVIFLMQYFQIYVEGYESNSSSSQDPKVNVSLPPHTPSSTTPSTTPTTTPSTTPSASDELDVIQKFLLSRGDFTNSVNDLIVFLSKKNGYDDLIVKLDNIKNQITNI
jgi:cytoskeletal protein RodZ